MVSEFPLVSVIVITYNSSKYVIETLDSIRNQSYPNIEIIITDDGSIDNTVNICRQWLNKNISLFNNVELLSSELNTGIAPNCNRGLKVAKGEWIKIIAGDDLLLPKCIEININATKSSSLKFFSSKSEILSDDLILKNKIECNYKNKISLFNGNQFENIINFGDFIQTVSIFVNRLEQFKVGLFNENYPFHEDFPMRFKILQKGYKFYFIDKYTVIYRVHNDSIYNTNLIINPLWHKSTKRFYFEEFFKELRKRKKYLLLYHLTITMIYYDLSIIFGNKNNFINKLIKLIRYLSPLYTRAILIKISNTKLTNRI